MENTRSVPHSRTCLFFSLSIMSMAIFDNEPLGKLVIEEENAKEIR